MTICNASLCQKLKRQFVSTTAGYFGVLILGIVLAFHANAKSLEVGSPASADAGHFELWLIVAMNYVMTLAIAAVPHLVQENLDIGWSSRSLKLALVVLVLVVPGIQLFLFPISFSPVEPRTLEQSFVLYRQGDTFGAALTQSLGVLEGVILLFFVWTCFHCLLKMSRACFNT
ncbi:hypothetical protein [Azotobacter vinelandii]|uniref:hypothetical protein n=1 Tax=Azotobacter vinelandii TaxID=354 RepID=UPI000773BEC3|nr:hypothetical protein [Azotobacter vinelandii]